MMINIHSKNGYVEMIQGILVAKDNIHTFDRTCNTYGYSVEV
jgi:propanediol utilization protein